MDMDHVAGAGAGGEDWQPVSMSDELLECVGVFSAIHLGQARVGMRKGVRICQGRRFRIKSSVNLPFQVRE